MTPERLSEIAAFVETNPVHATLLQELLDAVTTAQKQNVYYVRQLAERYKELAEARRHITAPRCEDCNTEMVEAGPDGEVSCPVCALEADIAALVAAKRECPRVDEDDERGGRR